MATTGKERQASFKKKMRETGKRQITIWVDGQQERVVKEILEDRYQEQQKISVAREFSEEEIAALCVVTAWFGAKTAAHLAGVNIQDIIQLLKSPEVKDVYEVTLRHKENRYELDMLAYKLDLRQHEIENREVALAARASELTSYSLVASTSIGDRIERLVKAFTTEPGKDGCQVAIDVSYRADQKAKEMADLSRKTSLAFTTVTNLVQHYGKLGILFEKEVTTLIDAGKVLTWVSNSAKQAKDRVTARAKKIAVDEERRQKEAAAAVKRILPDLSAPDAVLLLIHLTSFPSYETKNFRSLVPGNKADTDYLAAEVVKSARLEVRYKIEKELRAGRKVNDVADELLTGFKVAKPVLAEKWSDLVQHIVTCMTAARLMGSE